MSFTIKLAGTPYEFQAEASETILQAGDKAGFLLVVPIACAYPFFQRYIVAGLTIGSVKG